ncbi:probable bifunctional methylthioribulose-1-phosphate dehydratase/enolase-phosphatase E1 1 [Solanum tuberosum]|uniref:Enolase-phosphatase E1 n=1 Tax=Solanum tuberosum TaxID=4113 RepID=M1CCE3_SOLTU|nr:PREDICTED: probable bifunctional methylthioribulose-1-phosphate dehydratase/enolase-phosphatase E1 1 [Solanum tuberosum]KAH0721458.1 hypothetical protein KY284_006488 [Solanum tuberosum]
MAIASAAPLMAMNGALKMATNSQSYLEVQDNSIPKPQQLIVISPSGVQKERMVEEDMYVLSAPLATSYPHKPPKYSDCAPLFLKVQLNHRYHDATVKFNQFGLDWTTTTHGPIPNSNGALSSIQNVKMSAKAGALASNGDIEPLRRCIVLDIEGTTTPISFVTDVLFPYARDNVGRHLDATYDLAETQEDIELLRAQVQEDLENGVAGAVPIPSNDAGKEKVIAALVKNVEAMIKADRKITALKELQGHIWQTGFKNNELEGVVFDDVPEALERWAASGIKVYIYSSGSRLAQRLLFGYTNYGDLRKYLCGFFDTTVGNKKETKSYHEITASLGVDHPSEILFVTDVYQEAIAAKPAGLEVIISVRPGNGPLPDNHGFRTVKSFSEI